MFFEIVKFWKFTTLQISGILKIEIFKILQIGHFWNFPKWKFLEISKLNFVLNLPNWKFLEFPKLKTFRIFQIWSFWNRPNCKIKKFRFFFFNLENQSLFDFFIFEFYFSLIFVQNIRTKYMIVYKVVNSRNFVSFSNCSIFKICYWSKLNNFKKLIFF